MCFSLTHSCSSYIMKYKNENCFTSIQRWIFSSFFHFRYDSHLCGFFSLGFWGFNNFTKEKEAKMRALSSRFPQLNLKIFSSEIQNQNKISSNSFHLLTSSYSRFHFFRFITFAFLRSWYHKFNPVRLINL